MGGPFTGAQIVSMNPGGSAVTRIVETGSGDARGYRLEVTPEGHFDGTITIGYRLSNAFGSSATAMVTVQVEARPDPSQDPNVRGLSDAQAESTRRFARAQVDNFMRRTEQLHGDGGSGASMGVRLSGGDRGYAPDLGNMDDGALAITERMRSSTTTAGEHAYRRAAAGAKGMGDSRRTMDPGALGADVARCGGLNEAPAAAGKAAAAGAASGDGEQGRRIGSLGGWSGGSIDVSTLDARSGRSKISASTAGLSAGVDVKLADGVTVGVGGGYGSEVSHIGGSAARLRADGTMAAAYASLAPLDGAFVDGLIGFGDLDLRFDARGVSSRSGTLGGRLDSLRKTSFGSVTPRLRAEWRHEFADADPQMLDYADIVGASFYRIDSVGWTRDQFQAALGARFMLPWYWAVDLDLGLTAGQGARSGTMRVGLSKEF